MEVSLRDFDIFHGISQASLSELEKRIHVRSIARNQVLRYSSGSQHVHFLTKGLMKSVTADQLGQQLIKSIVGPGSFVGELPLMDSAERDTAFAQAIETSTVAIIHLTYIRQWLLESEEFRVRIKRLLANKVYNLEDRLLAVIYKTAEERIIEFIAVMMRQYGKFAGQNLRMKKFITDTDISQYVATSRQTVSQVMNDLRDKGRIIYNARYIEIPADSEIMVTLRNNDNKI